MWEQIARFFMIEACERGGGAGTGKWRNSGSGGVGGWEEGRCECTAGMGRKGRYCLASGNGGSVVTPVNSHKTTVVAVAAVAPGSAVPRAHKRRRSSPRDRQRAGALQRQMQRRDAQRMQGQQQPAGLGEEEELTVERSDSSMYVCLV